MASSNALLLAWAVALIIMNIATASSGPFASMLQANERPVTKVIKLMKDMLVQLEKEQEEDEKTYDAMVCWCETGDKQKTKAIADADQHTKDLAASIEELTAKSAQLTNDIASLTESIAKNEKALDESAAVRAKELAEFNQEEKDAIQAIGGLKSAVQVLGKHNGASLSQEVMLQLQHVLKPKLRHSELKRLGLAGPQKRLIMSFLQQPVAAQSYAPASGEIFGVMQAMKEGFETNLAKSKKEEEQGAKEYAQMKQAKEQEVAASNKAKDSKEVALANAGEDLENSKIDNKDTTAQLKADRKFLANLKEICARVDAEWEARQKMRQDETKAVNEALEILTDDDAKDLAAKTTGSAFIQTSMSSNRNRAAKLLREAGRRLDSPQLSLLANTLRNDVFAKIKESIDAMVAQLKVEAKDEIKHRDWCIGELNQLELDETEKYHYKGKQEQKKADLEARIAKLTDEIKAANAEVTDTQIEMKNAGETREKESKEFSVVIADQRAMQQILGKALGKLKAFYDRKSLLQLKASSSRAAQEPPAGFEPYKKQGGSGGVVGMLEDIIKESKEVEKHAVFDNHESQMAYEEFMVDANRSIAALRKSINDKTGELEESKAELARTDADLRQTLKDLDALNDYGKEIHGQCDFVLKNFEQRQAARTQEVDALNEAKAIMSQ